MALLNWIVPEDGSDINLLEEAQSAEPLHLWSPNYSQVQSPAWGRWKQGIVRKEA